MDEKPMPPPTIGASVRRLISVMISLCSPMKGRCSKA